MPEETGLWIGIGLIIFILVLLFILLMSNGIISAATPQVSISGG